MAFKNDSFSGRYQKEQTLGEALRAYLRAVGAETKIKEMRVLQAWDSVVGSIIAGDTSAINLQNGVLYVRFNSPIIRNEVTMRKSQIISRLNQEVGEELVRIMMVR
mgnify:FL=1